MNSTGDFDLAVWTIVGNRFLVLRLGRNCTLQRLGNHLGPKRGQPASNVQHEDTALRASQASCSHLLTLPSQSSTVAGEGQKRQCVPATFTDVDQLHGNLEHDSGSSARELSTPQLRPPMQKS